MYLTILLLPPSRGQELKHAVAVAVHRVAMLPPSRGQELKHHADEHQRLDVQVAPFTGAGIETLI